MVDFKQDINKFFKSVDNSKVRSLQELIDFNMEHSDLEMPPGKFVVRFLQGYANIL